MVKENTDAGTKLQIGKNPQLPYFDNLLLVKRIFFKSTRTPPEILYIDWEGLRRYKNDKPGK